MDNKYNFCNGFSVRVLRSYFRFVLSTMWSVILSFLHFISPKKETLPFRMDIRQGHVKFSPSLDDIIMRIIRITLLTYLISLAASMCVATVYYVYTGCIIISHTHTVIYYYIRRRRRRRNVNIR